MAVGILDVLKALDGHLIDTLARSNGIATEAGNAEKVIEDLLKRVNEDPLLMFAMTGALPDSMWVKVVKALDGAPQVFEREDWPFKIDAKTASSFMSFIQYMFLSVQFAPVEGCDCAYRLTPTVEALAYWREGGAEKVRWMREVFSRFFRLAQAAANLYGVLWMDGMCDIYEFYFGMEEEGYSDPSLLGVQLEMRSKFEGANFYIAEGDVVHAAIRDDADARKSLRKIQKKMAPWMPDERDEFLAFADEKTFLKTPAVTAFAGLLQSFEFGEHGDEMVRSLVGSWRHSNGDETAFRAIAFLMAREQIIDETAILDALTDIRNQTRTWEYFGHTAEELGRGSRVEPQRQMPKSAVDEMLHDPKLRKRMADAGIPAREVMDLLPKVGRNDPCPCGSGKKFKKCCGKDG